MNNNNIEELNRESSDDENLCVGLDYKRKLFYAPQYDAENLYFVLYYHYCDSNEKHFCWRKDSEVCNWSRNECLREAIDILTYANETDPLGELNNFCRECSLPDSLNKAIEDVRSLLRQSTEEDGEKTATFADMEKSPKLKTTKKANGTDTGFPT